jgi:hypothetical protein
MINIEEKNTHPPCVKKLQILVTDVLKCSDWYLEKGGCAVCM